MPLPCRPFYRVIEADWTSSWSLIQPKDHIPDNPLFCVIYNLICSVRICWMGCWVGVRPVLGAAYLSWKINLSKCRRKTYFWKPKTFFFPFNFSKRHFSFVHTWKSIKIKVQYNFFKLGTVKKLVSLLSMIHTGSHKSAPIAAPQCGLRQVTTC